MSRKLNGAHVSYHKNTKDMPCVVMDTPAIVTIPMAMHIGAPCTPIVKVGEEVKVGQKIADNEEAFVCAPIHASVSGKVKSISDYTLTNGRACKAIVIESDGEMNVFEDIKPPVINTKEEFVKAIRESGMVGLGGAGFPTHVKLNPKNLDEIDSLVINAAECEPYITVDNRECIDNTENVLYAVRYIQKMLNIKTAYIGIEANKPEAIKTMQEATTGDSNIEVCSLEVKYPQGAEKVLIYSTTGRFIPEGKLPSDVGVIALNVSTAGKIAAFLKTGMPLVSKNLTVDGGAINKAQNVTVPIGASIEDIANFCGGHKENLKKVLYGGPMMGIALNDLQTSIIKNTNAVLFFDEQQAKKKEISNCIRCGRCITHCPYNLMPVNFERAYERGDVETLKKLKVMMCMECGCCEFTCPAGRNLVSSHRLSKQLVRNASK